VLPHAAAARAARRKAPRAPSAAQQKLFGVEFGEDGVSWKVLHVEWSTQLGEMVVWYYDVEMAADAGLTDDDLDELRKGGEAIGPPELSSVSEVRDWIRDWKTITT
jgi:hypothetical protein